MAVQIITEVDLATSFSIPSADVDWLLPWYASITSDGDGIYDPGYLDNDRLVIEGSIKAAFSNFSSGIRIDAAYPVIEIGASGFIEADMGVSSELMGGKATLSNAGYIKATNTGIFFAAKESAVIDNSGVIDALTGISINASFVSKSIEIRNSGTIQADVGALFCFADHVSVDLTASSRIIVGQTALYLRSDSVNWEADVSNAGFIRAKDLAIDLGLGNDSVTNSGKIVGGISLGGGNDVFRSVGGKVDGDIDGGAGNDTFHIDNAALVVVEADGGGFDRIFASVSYSLASAYIDKFELIGSGNINATGADGDDTIMGNSGKNALVGLAGADLLDGGKSRDKLTGGDGADVFVMSRGTGSDIVLDYVDGTDRIDLRDLNAVSGFDDLVANHLRIRDGDAIISVGGDELIILNTKLSMFDTSDFIFADG